MSGRSSLTSCTVAFTSGKTLCAVLNVLEAIDVNFTKSGTTGETSKSIVSTRTNVANCSVIAKTTAHANQGNRVVCLCIPSKVSSGSISHPMNTTYTTTCCQKTTF